MEGGEWDVLYLAINHRNFVHSLKIWSVDVWIRPIKLAISLSSTELSSGCPGEVSVAQSSPFMTWVRNIRLKKASPVPDKLSGVSKCHRNQQDTCRTSGLGLDLVAFRVFSTALTSKCGHWLLTGPSSWRWREDWLLPGFALLVPSGRSRIGVVCGRWEGGCPHCWSTSIFLSSASKYKSYQETNTYLHQHCLWYEVPFAFLLSAFWRTWTCLLFDLYFVPR